jgi:integrase
MEKSTQETTLINLGRDAASLPPEVLRDASWAYDALSTYKVSIRQAVEDFISRHRDALDSIRVENTIQPFLKAVEARGVSRAHLDNLKIRLAKYSQTFGSMSIAAITTPEIAAWLASQDMASETRNCYRASISNLHEWARKAGYSRVNPVKDCDKAKVIREAPGIMDAATLQKVLDHSPDSIKALYVLSAFCGLRPSEAERVTWEQIDMEAGEVDVTAHKEGIRRRFVPIPANAIEWLKPLHRGTGKIWDGANRHVISHHRRILKKEHGVKWSHDVLRHTFASASFALHDDAAKISAWLGHTNATTLFQHYRKRITKKEATAWFAIRPRG